MSTTQQSFDTAYWLAQPPPVRALPSVADETTRSAQAAGLATNGYIIDVPIMVWEWDPYLIMTMRLQLGYAWVPSALQPPIYSAPGISQPGVPPYDPLHPPPGSIIVSNNIADYPPFDPPTPVNPPAPVADPVGLQAVGNIYLSVVGDTYPDGAQFTDSRGTFQKHLVVTPFGRNSYWELLATAS